MQKTKNGKNGHLLIFYTEPFEDRWIPMDRYPRAVIRRIIRGKRITGYRRCVQSLQTGLKKIGIPHCLNNQRMIRKNPDQVVALLGNAFVFEDWKWPNPIVAGPCMLDHPLDMPDLFEKHNVRLYLVASEWVRRMFEPYFGEKVAVWPIGIDTDRWPDFSGHPKSIDFLIYEKFLWNREQNAPKILNPIVEELRERGLSCQIIRSGYYKEHEYRRLLQASKYMIFLCEHETQGQAYQEALSCNVSILAWDQGFWLDPKRSKYQKEEVPASSVPYFSAECGMTFKSINQFEERLDEFMANSQQYQPRRYILEDLTLEKCAQAYVDLIRSA